MAKKAMLLQGPPQPEPAATTRTNDHSTSNFDKGNQCSCMLETEENGTVELKQKQALRLVLFLFGGLGSHLHGFRL